MVFCAMLPLSLFPTHPIPLRHKLRVFLVVASSLSHFFRMPKPLSDVDVNPRFLVPCSPKPWLVLCCLSAYHYHLYLPSVVTPPCHYPPAPQLNVFSSHSRFSPFLLTTTCFLAVPNLNQLPCITIPSFRGVFFFFSPSTTSFCFAIKRIHSSRCTQQTQGSWRGNPQFASAFLRGELSRIKTDSRSW